MRGLRRAPGDARNMRLGSALPVVMALVVLLGLMVANLSTRSLSEARLTANLEADARRFVEDLGLTFPLARDAERAVYVEYGVQGLPVAFFLEPGLQIRSRYDGSLDEATLREELDRLAGDAS